MGDSERELNHLRLRLAEITDPKKIARILRSEASGREGMKRLFLSGNWDAVRRGLTGITDPEEIGCMILSSHACHMKPVPDDTIQILMTKPKGNCTNSMRRGVATDGFGSAPQNFLVLSATVHLMQVSV